jgi:integrase
VAGQIIPRGKRTFVVRVFLGRDANGKRDYMNQTVRGSKKDAQALLNKLLRDKDMGTLLEPSRESLHDYLDRWLEAAAKPRLGASSYDDYERLLRYYIRPELGATPLQKLTALDIQKVYAGMQARNLSPRTVQYTHRVLRNALEQAVKWRLLTHNPAQHVELPKQERREMHFMTDEESRRFLNVAQSSPHYAFFTLMLSTGLRPSEALALRWQDVDTERCSVRITRTVKRIKGAWVFDEPKTKKSRRVVDYPVSLNEVLLAHRVKQAELIGETELVFASLEGTPLHEKNILVRYYRPLLKAAGLLETMRLYDLRHTHASLLLLAGVHPKVVSERLGHSSVVITLDTYSHVIPSLQRDSADRLDAVLFGEQAEAETKALN